MIVVALAAGGCPRSPTDAPPHFLSVGTWGATGAGVVVGLDSAHVHIGCTKGDFARPPTLDSEGRFNLPGQYILRAFPVQMGPPLPAQFTGVVRGNRLTLSVAVNDTVLKQLVALGPVTITLGREPQLGPCPICQPPASVR